MGREAPRSLPGMGCAEITTVSPGPTSTERWVPAATRLRAASGSPWEPVMRTAMSAAGSLLLSPASGATLEAAGGAGGDPAEGRQRLALGAGHEDGDVRVRDPTHVPRLDHHLPREVQVAELAGYTDVADHRASGDADKPVVLFGGLDDLADAVDVGGEGGHDDPARRPLENLLEGLLHHPLGRHVARPLGVGRVAEVREHALVAELGEAPEGHRLALDRREIRLVVAGEDDHPRRGAYGDGHRVRDGVVY